VLFADISGFTAMSERLDPEEVQSIMNRCFTSLSAVVDAHGGHIDKYIGDCIMALFGVPAALEDAPQRAINAAIEMRNRLARLNEEAALPARLDIHSGINTGLVIAGHVGGAAKQEFTVMGDAVNLASRLKDAAPHGAIWVGPETHRYAREDFEFRRLAPVALKGKQKPVEVHEVLSVKERFHRPRAAGVGRNITSPLIGREPELQLLRACLASAGRGEGGIVNLIGEAGLGKSRLLAEACAGDEARGALLLEARSQAVGQNLSFHPFVDLLRHWAAIGEDETDAPAGEKLRAAVDGLLGARAPEVFPFVATLMGIRPAGVDAARLEGIEGEALEKLIVRSMRELLVALAAAQPLVLVFEDLHWADRSSIQLLEALLRLVPEHAILFVHAFRPDHAATSGRILEVSRERYGAHQVEMSLDPLDDRQCAALIRSLLRIDNLPYATVATIARTTEGNPFFIEEVLRSLIDEGVVAEVKGRLVATERIESITIPGTIQGVIMARCDRLPEPARLTLQVASVLGRSFHHRILAQILPAGTDVDATLAVLKDKQLVLERRTHRTSIVRRRALTAEIEYVFKHALLQETVYASILQKTRKELHRRVAAAVETTFAERLDDFYATLAYHFSRAEDHAKAEEYLFKAGDEAARSAASSEALAFFREASRLYLLMHGEGGDAKKKALLEKNIALALLNQGELTESIDHFDRALAHLGEPPPSSLAARVARFVPDFTAVLFHAYFRAGRRGGVKDLEHEREVCELFFYRGRAETTSDPRRLFLELPTGLRRFNRIDPRAIEQAGPMYASCAALFAYSGISFAISQRMLGMAAGLVREGSIIDLFVYREARFACHYLQGDWDDVHAIDEALVEQDLRYGQLWDVTTYLGLECDRRIRRGDFRGARRLLAKLVEINDTYGYGFAGTTAEGMTAVLLLEERRCDEALAAAERYLSGRHEEALRVFALGSIAKAQLLRGQREAAARALAEAEDTEGRGVLISPWHQSAYLVSRLRFDATALAAAVESGDRAARRRFGSAARRSARRALAVARKVAKDRAEIHRLAGRVEWLLGRQRRALDLWARGVAQAERMGARPELARTFLEVGRRLGEERSQVSALLGSPADYVRRAESLLAEIGLATGGETPAVLGQRSGA
jgi:class 3 adenylate cyclase/tetratricopeptide (TPR) repeat protein